MEERNKTTMSVMEMGRMLGLKKTDAYWLVHKQCFETTLVQGIMRVNIESFEHWYANQIKHKKVDGPPPGEELKEYSYSIPEIAKYLDIPEYVAYDLIKRLDIETFEVDTWKRVRKDVFERWYRSQTKYRNPEDRARDAELEQASMTLPQMAKLLGIPREEAYRIVGRKENREIFEIVVIADRKRITRESFERWYQNQDHYHKAAKQTSGLSSESGIEAGSEREMLLSSGRKSFTVREAAMLIGTSPREIYQMIEDGRLDSFSLGKMVRIRRETLEWWLSPQETAFRKEEG